MTARSLIVGIACSIWPCPKWPHKGGIAFQAGEVQNKGPCRESKKPRVFSGSEESLSQADQGEVAMADPFQANALPSKQSISDSRGYSLDFRLLLHLGVLSSLDIHNLNIDCSGPIIIMGSAGQMIYIAGGPGGNSIGPAIHTYVANSLGLSWTCEFLRLPDVKDVMALFRRSDFAGGIVTMPHKRTIIPLLDSVDAFVEEIGACNFVVRRPDGHLHGTNTDWSGIQSALEVERCRSRLPTTGYSAMIYGAGGASRGAVYALAAGMNCREIYIVNRDEEEVAELMADVSTYARTTKPKLIHLTSMTQAEALKKCPQYIISTVPDFEPQSAAEITCRNILGHLLERGRGREHVLLDMCYHPPMTRNIQAGIDASWTIIPGFLVVSHQFAQQWHLWTGLSIDTEAVFSMCKRLVREREAKVSQMTAVA